MNARQSSNHLSPQADQPTTEDQVDFKGIPSNLGFGHHDELIRWIPGHYIANLTIAIKIHIKPITSTNTITA